MGSMSSTVLKDVQEWHGETLNRGSRLIPKLIMRVRPCHPIHSEAVRPCLDADHLDEAFDALEVVRVGRVERELVASRHRCAAVFAASFGRKPYGARLPRWVAPVTGRGGSRRICCRARQHHGQGDETAPGKP